MNQTAPETNEIELSLFGPGLGESIVCHLGSGHWMVVDSCVNPGDRGPIALKYLWSLGLDPSEVVKLVVATHWHDDHINGLATILKDVPNAKFALTSAFANKDFQVCLAPWLAPSVTAEEKGLDDLIKIQNLGRRPVFSPFRERGRGEHLSLL